MRTIDIVQFVLNKLPLNNTMHIYQNAMNIQKNSTLLKLPEEGRVLEFTNFKNQLQRPYIVYADTECTLVKSKEPGIFHKHVANSACFLFCV